MKNLNNWNKQLETWAEDTEISEEESEMSEEELGSSDDLSEELEYETNISYRTLTIQNKDLYPDGTLKQKVLDKIFKKDNNITKLYFLGSDIKTLPILPEWITCIYLNGCDKLEFIEKFPSKLKTLDIGGTNFEAVPSNLPEDLERLFLQDMNNLKSFDNLPSKLKFLDISIDNLEAVPSNLPESLEILHLRNMKKLESIDKLPSKLKILDLRDTPFKTLPALPESLEVLDLRDMGKLESIDVLPPNLEILLVSGLTNLISFNAYLSDELAMDDKDNILDLNDSEKLIETNELVAKLLQFEHDSGNLVSFPKHFKLTNQIEEIKDQLDDLPDCPKIIDLCEKYLSQDMRLRGDVQTIINNFSPIADYLEQHPTSIYFIEEIANSFLAGCSNQPVAGVREISAYIAIANAPTMSEKVEAAKQLFAIEVVKYLVNKTKIEDNYKAEFVNTMFREVHKKLLGNNDIKAPWPASSEKFAHEDYITPDINDSNINFVYSKVKNALSSSTNIILGSAPYFAYAAFPEEVNEIKARFAKQKAAFPFASDAVDCDEKDLVDLKAQAKAKGCLDEFNNLVDRKLNLTELNEEFKQLGQKEVAEILNMAQTKVEEGLRTPSPSSSPSSPSVQKSPKKRNHSETEL